MFSLDNDHWCVIRVKDHRVEVLYEMKRGPLHFARWESWQPSDHVLAVMSYDDARSYVDYENNSTLAKAAE
jgi:hypothetical protein